MKTIYLRDENYNWKSYQYKELNELESEFKKRNISIGYRCNLGNDCNLGYRCNLGNDCNLGDRCNLGNGCNLGNDCNLITGLFIYGSKYTFTYTGGGTVQIGCHNMTIHEWLKSGDLIAEKEGFTEEQKKEYKLYLQMANKLYKFNKMNDE